MSENAQLIFRAFVSSDPNSVETAVDQITAQAIAEERDAVVEFLMAQATVAGDDPAEGWINDLAHDIAHGKHRSNHGNQKR